MEVHSIPVSLAFSPDASMMNQRFTVLLTVLCCQAAIAQVDQVVPFTSSNLPIVVINTNGATIVDDPKITADMGIIDNGPDRNNLTDPYNGYEGKIGIEIRGSSSQMFPKKQYGIELWDALGEGQDASLLGLPEEEDWILFAPYNDKSLMRDAMAYKLARDMGQYAPRTRFCELVLNDVYQGIYVLIEKIKRDNNRVDIAKLDPDEVSGDDLTGGYIIKIDKFTGGGGDGWQSDFPPPHGLGQEVFFQYEYPDAEDIVEGQRVYIESVVKQFEQVLASSAFAHPQNGYSQYIDVNSFVDYFLMQEVTKNVDGYRLSTFFYKQKDSDGGKIVMGPIWDFNLGFGNADYCTSGSPTGFVLEFNEICSSDYWLIPFWWERLLQDNTFRMAVAARWATLRTSSLSTETIHAYIDSVASVLNEESQQRNFQAWDVLGAYIWPNYYVGDSFGEEVDWLKEWIEDRMVWLDENLPSLITAAEKGTPPAPSVMVYPNPLAGEGTLSYNVDGPGTVNLRVFNSVGSQVLSLSDSHGEAGNFEMKLGALGAPGLYYYVLRHGELVLGSGVVNKQ
jgi:hypothetical protein